MARPKGRNIKLKDRIYIVGEGITEQYYFKHLKQLNQYSYIVKPRFFGKTSIQQIEKTVQNLLSGGVTVICVFDADVAYQNKTIKQKFEQFLKRYQNEASLIICDSLPSIEFWFLLHFVKTNRHFKDSKAVERELKKHIKQYKKSQKFLENTGWVEQLSIQLDLAIKNVQSIEINDATSYSNVFKAFEILNKKNRII